MSENKRCGFESKCPSMIEVPGYLPKLLTEWSKAAMRTCPSDILQWSAIYFRMKGNGEHPPVKPYLEPPDLKPGPGGLTPNCLKALAATLRNALEPYEKIEKMWDVLSLNKNIFLEITEIGKFDSTKHIKPKEFIAIAAAYLNNRLRDTMILLCDTFSENDSDGILLEHFVSVYRFLARIHCADESLSANRPPVLESTRKTSKNSAVNAPSHVSQSLGCESSPTDNRSENDCSSGFDDSKRFDAESARGIPFWEADDVEIGKPPESIAELLEKSTIEPPADFGTCDDPDFLHLLKQSRQTTSGDGTDDLLSQLSASSVISGSADDSFFASSSSTVAPTTPSSPPPERIASAAEEPPQQEDYGETMSDDDDDEPAMTDFHLKAEDSVVEEMNPVDEWLLRDYDVYNEQQQPAERSVAGSGEGDDDDDENAAVVAGDVRDVAAENGNGMNVAGANKDFVVMMALVVDGDGKDANADDESMAENESSAESEFSLLDRTELNDTTAAEAEHTADGDKYHRPQEFDENLHIVTAGKESSDSGSSSNSRGSGESRYSEIDQQSDVTVPSVNALELSPSEIASRDRLLAHDVSSWASPRDCGEFDECAEEFEHQDEAIVEKQMRSWDLGESPAAESVYEDETVDEKTCVAEETHVYVMPGIGPAIPEKRIKRVIDWVTECAIHQNYFVKAHNLLHFLCPPLDLMSPSVDPDTV